ncbi:MAG: ABC transporter permease [Prevotella sp.]|jgi:ABC-type antimicrobial peptide transport system permease subunit|nr:ABC transporter permease [Prevotella sp.]
MLKHYFKIAFRNLWKYKVQTVISIVGLAIGFTCFSLSALWREYESSYDHFHPKADRIYLLRGSFDNGTFSESKDNFEKVVELRNDLKAKFPQIEDIAYIKGGSIIAKSEYLRTISVNQSFFNVFDLRDPGFQYNQADLNSIILTDKIAGKIFPDEDPLTKKMEGKDINVMNGDMIFEVRDVIKSWPLNTNIEFNAIRPLNENEETYYTQIFLLLYQNTDWKAFNEIIGKYENRGLFGAIEYKLEIIPIKSLRQEVLNKKEFISYNSIGKFAFTGLLVIICAIFNYLILLVSRIRIRSREMALRKVNGATDNSFLLLFGIEVLLVLVISLLLALFTIHLILPSFKDLSKIVLDDTSIYINALIYCCVVIVYIMLVTIIQIYYFKKKTLREGIVKSTKRDGFNYFYKICVFLQLFISIGLIYCTTIFIKQVNHLSNADIGFKWKNIVQIFLPDDKMIFDPVIDKIENVPHIKNVLFTQLAFWSGWSVTTISSWDGKADDEPVVFNLMMVTYDFFDFYGLTFVEGQAPDRETEEKQGKDICYINEAAAKFFGWHESVGKMVDSQQVRGVLKDYLLDPRKQAEPIIFRPFKGSSFENKRAFLYEYEGMHKEETEKAITEIMEKTYPGAIPYFDYKAARYQKFFTSEEALLKILRIATIVCIVISIFGIYSMVSLICTKRRKEIAIRKVNGATVFSIVWQMLREQWVLVLIAAAIAFPIGYKIMLVWIENYIQQTPINWWIYAFILIGILLVVTATVFTQVWRAANQNPAEVLKSE